MKIPSGKLKQIIAIVSLAIIVQVSFISSSFADSLNSPQGTSGDLSLSITAVAKERAFAVTVCNNGTDPITSIDLDISSTNYTFDNQLVLPLGLANNNASDLGTYDAETGIWQGVINPAGYENPGDPLECIAIGYTGIVTGQVGQTITFTASIISSVLGDSTSNIDPNNNNDSDTYTTAPIVLDPDLALETRLLTTGEITAGSPVSFGLKVTNNGLGDYIDDQIGIPFGVYFIIPNGSTFVDVTDADLTDNVTITPGDCAEVSNDVSTSLPAFASYHGALLGCQLIPTSGVIAPGESFELNFNMTASGPFSTGNTQAIAIITANDVDNILLQATMFTPSTDPFNIVNDNVSVLTYDGNALAVTINPCNGTNTVVNVNDACFKVTFNKKIVDESFTQDDLVLTGGGTIYEFTKTSANEWTVRMNGLPVNENVTLSLDIASVQDYSAILNQTEVLGINQVRYEVLSDVVPNAAPTGTSNGTVSGSVSGSLPQTGFNDAIYQFALVLMLLGSILTFSSKRSFNATNLIRLSD